MQIESSFVSESLSLILEETYAQYNFVTQGLSQTRIFPNFEACMSYVRRDGDEFLEFLLETKYLSDTLEITIGEGCEEVVDIRAQLEETLQECEDLEEVHRFAITVRIYQLINENQSASSMCVIPVDPTADVPIWNIIPLFFQQDFVCDVMDDMYLRQNKMFINSPGSYSLLERQFRELGYAGQDLKLRHFKTRYRSAGLSLEHLEHPMPMISGPTFQELKAMLIGFYLFVVSDKFLADFVNESDEESRSPWICFALKAMFKHRFRADSNCRGLKGMWENVHLAKTDRAMSKDDMSDPIRFKETFEKCAQQYADIPGSPTENFPVFLLHADEDHLSSVCLELNPDLKRNIFDEKHFDVDDVLKSLLADHTWEQISVSAHKWGGVPRAHLTIAGNRCRMREIQDIHELMRRASQMIVVESDAKETDWEEVVRPYQHSGIVQSTLTTSVKILFLNYGQFCLTLKKLEDRGYTTRIGTKTDYDRLFPEFWRDFGGCGEINDEMLEEAQPTVSGDLVCDVSESARGLSDKVTVLEHAEKQFEWEKQDPDCSNARRRKLPRCS